MVEIGIGRMIGLECLECLRYRDLVLICLQGRRAVRMKLSAGLLDWCLLTNGGS